MSKAESASLQDGITVVLIEPRKGGNIGSVARAMRNMGLQNLRLVRPLEQVTEECRQMAGKAIDVVHSARICDSMTEAIADHHLVIGTTSARQRQVGRPVQTPRGMASRIRAQAVDQRVALVFGSERGGLNEDQLSRCQYLVSIPTNPAYPVLNLAQAVLIVTYEIWVGQPREADPAPALASEDEREQMYRHLEQVLLQVGFLSSQNPDHIMRSIRKLLGRADLGSREVQILQGILSQLEWFIREGHKLPREKVVKP